MNPNQENYGRGITFSMLAFLFFSFSDATRKYISVDYPVSDILFWQAIFGLLALICLIPFFGGVGSIFEWRHLSWNVLRGILMAVNTCMSIYAISNVPIMDAYTIFFLTPFITTIISALVFQERVGKYRITAILCGFLGALVAFRPGFEQLEISHILALMCCFTFAFSNIIARRIGRQNNKLVYGFWPFLILIIAFIFVFQGIAPVHDLRFFLFCIWIGLCYAMAAVLIAYSFTLAPASVVAPYQYVQLISALVLGYFIFGDFPDFFKIVGVLIIIASGLFLFARERWNRKKNLIKLENF